jgi:capsular polysaccharide biosynthesis protein
VRRAHSAPDHKAIALSGALFQRLLIAYPKAHRRKYGPAMVQLFRDQCRDAWSNGRGWGLTGLWLQVLPDLLKTSVLEHISTLKERKTMLERLGVLLRPRSAPWFVFAAVSVPVFVLVIFTTTLVTFIMPESYSSTARIKPDWTMNDRAGQLEFESIKSDAVLGKVIKDLDLNRVWGNTYAGGRRLKTSESLALLKARIEVRPVRTTSLIEIRVFSGDASEAARLANAIADTYREYRSSAFSIEIVDRAVPGLRPVRPNKPLNITLAIFGGLLLALAAGAAIAGIMAWFGRNSGRTGTPPAKGPASPPTLPPADSPLSRSTLAKVT